MTAADAEQPYVGCVLLSVVGCEIQKDVCGYPGSIIVMARPLREHLVFLLLFYTTSTFQYLNVENSFPAVVESVSSAMFRTANVQILYIFSQ